MFIEIPDRVCINISAIDYFEKKDALNSVIYMQSGEKFEVPLTYAMLRNQVNKVQAITLPQQVRM